MRKIIAISFLFVFTLLQYGKIVSWLYCELRIEITDEKTTHCDCEKIVADGNDKMPASTPHSHLLKEKLNEPYTSAEGGSTFILVINNTSCFSFKLNGLQKGFLDDPYHPPAIVC